MDQDRESEDEDTYSYRLLLECDRSKRVVECKSKVADLQSILEKEVQKIVGAEVKLIFDVSEYRRAARTVSKAYLLQRFSSEWNEFVDVIDAIEVDTKDRLKAVPMQATSDTKTVLFA